ncbi:alpha/beta hydrolase [Lacisediminihabitans sp.]|uniref:alpha/beta hydrolase n=1 Tax=Lacisediminihabitans sp. TaxID=2787631 RepID=UPI00374CFD8A
MRTGSLPASAIAGAILRSVVAVLLLVTVFLVALIASQGAGRGWVAWAVTLAIGLGGGLLARYRGTGRRRSRWRWAPLGLVALLTALVCLPTVPAGHEPPRALQGVATERWELSTGSRVAVYHYPPPAESARRPVPLLYLHGGPIRSISMLDHRFLAGLAHRGYDVYAYEQAGAGRSDLLAIDSYSIDRELADLNAVIRHLDRGPVDVLGFSAGGSLLTRALADPATEPNLHRAIIAEPGPMDGPTAALTGRKGEPNAAGIAPGLSGPRSTAYPRYAAAFGLLRLGLLRPDSQLVAQPEALNAFTAADLGSDTASAYCARDADRLPVEDDADNFTFNVAASTRVQDSIRRSPSLAAHLGRSTTPAMLMMAECSSQVRAWETTIIHDDPALRRVQYLPGVGHHLWNGLDDNNERAYAVITAFLDGRPAPLPNYPTRADLPRFAKERR